MKGHYVTVGITIFSHILIFVHSNFCQLL